MRYTDALAAERRALRWLSTPDEVWDTVLATRALVESSKLVERGSLG